MLPVTAMLRVISAVLLFGNMKFQQDRKSDQATLPDNTGRLGLVCNFGLSGCSRINKTSLYSNEVVFAKIFSSEAVDPVYMKIFNSSE